MQFVVDILALIGYCFFLSLALKATSKTNPRAKHIFYWFTERNNIEEFTKRSIDYLKHSLYQTYLFIVGIALLITEIEQRPFYGACQIIKTLFAIIWTYSLIKATIQTKNNRIY